MPVRLGRFEMPKRLQKDDATATDTYAKFIADPFETGYGHTIGNSLRRVLLSSLEGAAITSIKVDGVLLVKGSGTDLRTIGPEGFTRLDLARLARLRETGAMSDVEMMRFMAACMVADGPAPSVETPLHALLPHRVIAHTHDVATMSITNVGDGG